MPESLESEGITPEQQAEMERSRTLSDAELLKQRGVAGYVVEDGKSRLEAHVPSVVRNIQEEQAKEQTHEIFEKATMFAPQLPESLVGKPLSEAKAYVESTYGAEYNLAGNDYWDFISRLESTTHKQRLPNGKYYFLLGVKRIGVVSRDWDHIMVERVLREDDAFTTQGRKAITEPVEPGFQVVLLKKE